MTDLSVAKRLGEQVLGKLPEEARSKAFINVTSNSVLIEWWCDGRKLTIECLEDGIVEVSRVWGTSLTSEMRCEAVTVDNDLSGHWAWLTER